MSGVFTQLETFIKPSFNVTYTAVQSQKAVSAYFTSKQIL